MKKIMGIAVYDVKEASELLGITTNTIHTYIRNKQLDARKLGGRWYITDETLRAFVGFDELQNQREEVLK